MSNELKLKAIEQKYKDVKNSIEIWHNQTKTLLSRSFKEDGTMDLIAYKEYLNFLTDTKFDADLLNKELQTLQELDIEYYLSCSVK